MADDTQVCGTCTHCYRVKRQHYEPTHYRCVFDDRPGGMIYRYMGLNSPCKQVPEKWEAKE